MTVYGFDTETWLIQPGLLAPPLVCGTVACEMHVKILDKKQTIAWFREKLESSWAHVVGTRLSYDLGVLCNEDNTLVPLVFKALKEGRLHDISIREALKDIAGGSLAAKGQFSEEMGLRYSLKELALRYLGIDMTEEKTAPDAWRLRYAELDGIPIEQWPWPAIRYPLRDAQFPLEIFHKQEGSVNLHDEIRQMRADFVFHLISMWGLRTNEAKVNALDELVEKEWLEVRKELHDAGIFRFDGEDYTKDTKVIAELVTMAYGWDPPKTPTGKPSTDRDTLVESGDEILIKLGNAGKNDKRKSQYIPILRKGTKVPWNPQFNTLVATGRASSDAQQFPTGNRSGGGIRECFEPRPGVCYCSVDYEGLELRTMSQVAIWQVGWSEMAKVLNAGQDPHIIIACDFMDGVSYDEGVKLKKAKDKRFGKFRDLGKIFNFGKGGGMGAAAMAYQARSKDGVRFCLSTGECEQCGRNKTVHRVAGKDRQLCALCVEISKRLGYKWLARWTEQKARFELASELTKDGFADVEVPVSKRIRGGCTYTQWLNTPFQGLGGDICKDAMWQVALEMYCDPLSPLFGSRLVLMVHDELIAELRLEKAAEAAERISQIMVETGQRWMPDLAPSVKAEPAISMIMSKSMAPVRDENGRLKLWMPET